MGSRIHAHSSWIAGLCAAVAGNLASPSLAQTFCAPTEQFFQNQPMPATPRERVNDVNLSRCSSGMPCLNQLRAAMLEKQPLPAAHRLIKRDPPQPDCLRSVPTASEPAASASPTDKPLAPTP